jgi:hypothetical protein
MLSNDIATPQIKEAAIPTVIGCALLIIFTYMWTRIYLSTK